MRERRLTIAVVGTISVVALLGAVALAVAGGATELVLALLGVCTSALSLLAPSPLSKTAVPDAPRER